MVIFNMIFGGDDDQKSRDDIIKEAQEVDESDLDEGKKDDGVDTGNAKLDMEITKIKSQLDALNEVRKATQERFSRISEQIGEMRGMITDLSKTISKVEVGATKAIDLVESVQPEKLMVQVRKQDAKVEAVKAHLESTEARMKDMMSQIKDIREQMDVYQGLEQVQNLNEEMKDELAEMRKMQVNIEKHADRVETMFMDVNEKFVEFDKFNDRVKDMKREFDKMQNDMEKFKVKIEDRAEKKELVNLIDRFQDFQKHTDNVLKLLDERSKNMKEDLFTEFQKIKTVLEHKYEVDFEEEEKRLKEEGKMDEKGIKEKVKGKIKNITGKGGEEEVSEEEDKQIVEEGKSLDEEGEQPADAGEEAPETGEGGEEQAEPEEGQTPEEAAAEAGDGKPAEQAG